MKHLKTWIFSFFIIYCFSVSYSQKITTGVYSGVNFSDIHGQDLRGKWAPKPGPSEGFSLGYAFDKTIGIQTGIGYSTVYYEYRQAGYQIYYPYDFSNYYPITGPVYYPTNSDMNCTFLRIPLLFTVSVPSVLQFKISTGPVFSFVKGSSFKSYYFYSSSAEDFKKNDFGYLFSSGISYPLSNKIDLTLNLNYYTGRKKFMEYSNFRHGYSEISFGIDYTFLKKDKKDKVPKPESDSLNEKVTVTYNAGINYSWNNYEAGLKKYSPVFGPSFGFSVNVPLSKGAYFITGVSFERKGYSLKDSSASYYMYLDKVTPTYYVDTKVLADYAIIPFKIRLAFGKPSRVFFETGPWLGLKLNARNVGVAYGEDHNGSSYRITKYIINDDLERLISDNDIGWLFSSGVSIPLPEKYVINLAVQYTSGFKNIYDKKVISDLQPANYETPEIKNRTLGLRIGLTFPSNKH